MIKNFLSKSIEAPIRTTKLLKALLIISSTVTILEFYDYSFNLMDSYEQFSYFDKYSNIIFIIVCLVMFIFIIVNKSSSLYNKFCYGIVLLSIIYIHLYIEMNYLADSSIIWNDILAWLLLGSLTIFNLHFIRYVMENYLPSFRNKSEAYNPVKINLSMFNLFLILFFIIIPTFAIHYHYHSGLLIQSHKNLTQALNITNSYSDIITNNLVSNAVPMYILIFLYYFFLPFIFFSTASIHIWLNMSIIYSLRKNLPSTSSIDLFNPQQYAFLKEFTSFLTKISFLYSILLTGAIIEYKLVTPFWEMDLFIWDSYYLALFFLICITASLVIFLNIRSLATTFVDRKLLQLHNEFNIHNINFINHSWSHEDLSRHLEIINKNYQILKDLSKAFDTNLIMLAEVIPIFYITLQLLIIYLKNK